MTNKEASQIANAHGAMIGRRRPGTYYVTFSVGPVVSEVEVTGKTVKCAVDWVLTNLRVRTAADLAVAAARVQARLDHTAHLRAA